MPVPRRAPFTDLAWRTVFRLGFPLARLWWRWRRPAHEGALVAIHVGPALLVLRASYRRGWTLPGGGIRRGEAPEAAARRELREELGITAPALCGAGIVTGLWDGRRDRVHLFELRLAELPALCLDNREIVAARLAGPAELAALPLTGPLAAYLAREAAPRGGEGAVSGVRDGQGTSSPSTPYQEALPPGPPPGPEAPDPHSALRAASLDSEAD